MAVKRLTMDELSSGNFPVPTAPAAPAVGFTHEGQDYTENGEEIARAGEEDWYHYKVESAEAGIFQAVRNFQPLVLATSFPTERRNQLLRADYWLDTDELLGGLVEIKQDFTAMGLGLRPYNRHSETATKTDTDPLAKFKVKLGLVEKKWGWLKIVEDLLRDWYSKDTMILYWKVDLDPDESSVPAEPPAENSKEDLIPGLREVCALNPAECDWKNSFGQDILRYKIPKELRNQIWAALTEGGVEERAAKMEALRRAGVEEKYILAVKNQQEWVDLKPEDGDNWLIETRARKRHGIAKPSMTTIFMALESRKMLTEGEFSASLMMKHFLFQAKCGESITQGPLAGTKNNWAKPKDIDKLHGMLKATSRAQRVATNHTVTFVYVFPPEEMWSLEKFKSSEVRIFGWSGVTLVLYSGTGGTNAGGHIGVRRMIASMKSARDKISLMVYNFFDDPVIRAICGIEDDVDIKAIFDENALKEPRQLLDEVKFLVTEGQLGPTSALSELGRDPDTVRDAKKASILENEDTHVWEPIFEKGARSREGERTDRESGRGRPAGAGTTRDAETRTQSPPAISS